MGNSAIIIRAVGGHQAGYYGDADQVAQRCVDELRATGSTVLSAVVETGGVSIDLLGNAGGSEKTPLLDASKQDGARAAYERYLYSSGGKSLISGAELPRWDALSSEIQAAWMAAVDHTQPRLMGR